MKSKEKDVILKVNRVAKTQLIQAKNIYSNYDAEDDNYIVEVKCRNAYYKDKMLETYKFLKCIKEAQSKDKQFLYIVEDPKGVWVYNCSKYLQDIVDFENVEILCPKTTEFSNNSKTSKDIILLPESYAVRI